MSEQTFPSRGGMIRDTALRPIMLTTGGLVPRGHVRLTIGMTNYIIGPESFAAIRGVLADIEQGLAEQAVPEKLVFEVRVDEENGWDEELVAEFISEGLIDNGARWGITFKGKR